MLQPMHSRISSSRPSSIFFGRNGSAIDGRAAPIMSSTPSRDHAHHRVGRREAADADDGLRGERLQAADVLLVRGLRGEPRRRGVVLPLADDEVPHVGQLADEAEDALDVGPVDPVGPEQLVDRDPARDRRPAVDLLERVLEDLAQEPGAVLEAAAVAVGARVVPARQELAERVQAVRGVDVDDVEARFERAPDGGPVPAANGGDVIEVHAPHLHRVVGRDRKVADGQPGLA